MLEIHFRSYGGPYGGSIELDSIHSTIRALLNITFCLRLEIFKTSTEVDLDSNCGRSEYRHPDAHFRSYGGPNGGSFVVADIHSDTSEFISISDRKNNVSPVRSVRKAKQIGLGHRIDPCFRSYGGPNGSWSQRSCALSPSKLCWQWQLESTCRTELARMFFPSKSPPRSSKSLI